jgi:hypothetical protein
MDWFDSGLDYPLELKSLLGLDSNATDQEVEDALAELKAGRKKPSLAEQSNVDDSGIRLPLKDEAKKRLKPKDYADRAYQDQLRRQHAFDGLVWQLTKGSSAPQIRNRAKNVGPYLRNRLNAVADKLEDEA